MRWYTMPHPVGHYRISSRNLEVDKTRVRALIDDALSAADRDVDFSRYSFTVIFLGAKLADYGMIGLCGYPGMLGWMAEGALKTKSGQVVHGGIAIFSFQAHLGTLFHDVAHVLGGVRDAKDGSPASTITTCRQNPARCGIHSSTQPFTSAFGTPCRATITSETYHRRAFVPGPRCG